MKEYPIKNYFVIIVMAFVLSILVRNFILEIMVVEGVSMEDTLKENDKVMVLKTAKPEKGDIVVIENGEKLLIKRVIATAGDTLEIKNGEVIVNNKKINEPYIKDDKGVSEYESITLEEDTFFVLGDNRNLSADSRMFGAVNNSEFIGEVLFSFSIFGKKFSLH